MMELLMLGFVSRSISRLSPGGGTGNLRRDLSRSLSPPPPSLGATVNYNWQTQCAARSLRQLVIHDNGIADV